ncbi:MAG TPA: hypothetical protein VFA38_11690 [Nitrospirales bacterium]|nr:hypothetical protein [Nitrospirales bacterium]
MPILAWFVSGIVMAYTGGMPRLTAGARLAHLEPLNLLAIRASLPAAASRVQRPPFDSPVINTVLGRPAYHFRTGKPAVVFADTGQLLEHIGPKVSVQIAAEFLGIAADRVRYLEELRTADQWTVGQAIDMPVHKLTADDGHGTELYVSESLGEVVLMTERRDRALAWIGAIPHWWYVAAFRRQAALWRFSILSASAGGALLAALGLVVGIAQAGSRYRGAMRWHYRAGIVFGVFAVSWLASGWLSLQPWNWAPVGDAADGIEAALGRTPIDVQGSLPAIAERAADFGRAADGPIKEIELTNRFGDPAYIVRTDTTRAVLSARTLRPLPPVTPEEVKARIEANAPTFAVATSTWLTGYDSYYRDRASPLPVVRIDLRDADATSLYVDSMTGAAVATFTRRQRVERWIYHGAHSLDVPFAYSHRGLWRAIVIALCTGGAVLSGTAAMMTVKRFGRRTFQR